MSDRRATHGFRWRGKRKKLIASHKKHNGLCYYCGRRTEIPESGVDKRHSFNMASLDHVYSCNDIRRFLNFKKVVLSCYKCNQDKNNKERRDTFNAYYRICGFGRHKGYVNIINILSTNKINLCENS